MSVDVAKPEYDEKQDEEEREEFIYELDGDAIVAILTSSTEDELNIDLLIIKLEGLGEFVNIKFFSYQSSRWCNFPGYRKY